MRSRLSRPDFLAQISQSHKSARKGTRAPAKLMAQFSKGNLLRSLDFPLVASIR